jgi:hypothetical protein
MTDKIKQGFQTQLLELSTTELLFTKVITPQIKQGRKYAQVLSSIREVGLIEQPVVAPLKKMEDTFYWTGTCVLLLSKNWE